MEYNEILKNRFTTFAWSEEKVSDEVIRDVAKEVYDYYPSKNLKFPYTVDIVDNTNHQQRKELHMMCHRNTDMNVENDKGNPQVLAPTLLVFCNRNVEDLEVIFQKVEKRKAIGVVNTDNIEIGIAVTGFILGLTARGIHTALCQCLREQEKIAKLLDIDGFPYIILGVGYNSESMYYMDPRNDKERRIPYDSRVKTPYIKPDFGSIYRFKDK